MIINKLIDKETFNSLMEMYKRQGVKVTHKVLDEKFVSYVTEGVQHIFIDKIIDYPARLIGNQHGGIVESSSPNKIWKYNKVTGYWHLEKSIDNPADIDKWLDIFKKDEPKEFFVLSKNKPKHNPKENIDESIQVVAEGFEYTPEFQERLYNLIFKRINDNIDYWPVDDESLKKSSEEMKGTMSGIISRIPETVNHKTDKWIIKAIEDNLVLFAPGNLIKGLAQEILEFIISYHTSSSRRDYHNMTDYFNSFSGSKKSKDKSKVNESIQVVAKDFIKHHGKNPSGVGSWIFGIGSRKSDDWFEYKGKFTDGKKKAILKAEEAEASKVYVMENVSGENHDVRFTITEGKKTYRVALLVEGKEVSVTNAITEGGAVNIGAKQVHDILTERSLSKPEINHREDIVHAMKSKVSDFRKRYGDKAKSVMYGTATKLAKEDINEDEDPNIGRKWMDRYGDEIEIEFMKDGKYYTTKNGRPGGGEIIPAEQLERTIKVDTSWYNRKLETDKELADQEAAAKAAKQAKDSEYSGIKGSSKLDTGRKIKALDKKLRLSSGEILTVKQIIDREIQNGAKLEVHNFWNDKLGKSVPETVLMSPDDTYRDQKNIGKIGLEYARQVLDQTNESLTETEELDERDYHDSGIWYHGSHSGLFVGAHYGLHVGTKLAATQALESRIGVPAEGEWDGTREYGKTLLAGKKSLLRKEKERGYYVTTGFNVGKVTEDDYYPGDRDDQKAEFSDGSHVNPASKPKIFAVKINVPMSNTRQNPMQDYKANGYMKANITKGTAKRGYYYVNDGEDEGSISAVLPNNNSVTVVNESIIEKDTNSSIKKGTEEPTPEPYTEEEGSTFESNGNFYDMNTILSMANEIQEVEDFDVDTLEWVLDYDRARLDDLKTAEDRVESADTSVPILIYHDHSQPEDEEWVVVDGVQRLAKAMIDGDKTIPAKIITDEIMDQAFISQDDEKIVETKTYTQRAPYKIVKVKNIYGETIYKIQDKSGNFLSAELDKKDADVLVKNLNSISEIELNEATKPFEVKYRTVDGDNTTEGKKVINAPDQGKARSRFLEDNTELKGLQVISVSEVR